MDSHQDDALQAIEELHRNDRVASLAGDVDALIDLWSDDPAALPPDGPMLRGRSDLERALRAGHEGSGRWDTVEYRQSFEEVFVSGSYAWDWGTYRGRSRDRDTGREVESSGKLLRILKRAADGSWKVHRSMWTVDRGPSEEGAG